MIKVLAFIGLGLGLAAAAPFLTLAAWPDLLRDGSTALDGWRNVGWLYEHRAALRPKDEIKMVSAMFVVVDTTATFALFLLGGLLGWFFSIVRVPWWLFAVVGLALLPFACTFRPFAGLPADPATQLRPAILLALACVVAGLVTARGLKKL